MKDLFENIVFIATSIDGYIADKNGGIAWLDTVPIPEDTDMGYYTLMDRVDAVVMGRVSFETVCGFDVEWPYSKPVFVLSSTLETIPEKFRDKAEIVRGPVEDLLDHLHGRGFHSLYIDGGSTIQSFLKKDLIDEMIITRIPVLLGGGIPLFGDLPELLEFEHIQTQVFVDALVQDHYRRKR